MSIDINISSDLDSLEGYLDDMKQKALTNSVRNAMNRTLLTLRKKSIELIRVRLKIKVGVIRKKHLNISRAKGGSVRNMEAKIMYNTQPIPLIEFIKGSKQPRNQKGIKVRKRKPLKAEITPGKRIRLKTAFIADIKTKQVFKRAGPDTRRVKKQGVVSVGFIFQNRGMRKELQSLGGKRFSELFEKEYAFQLERSKTLRMRRSKIR